LIWYTTAPIANPAATAARAGVVVLNVWDTPNLHALKTANKNCKVLAYQSLSGCVSSPPTDGGFYASAVTKAQAQPEGWLLNDATTGQPFTFKNYPWIWAADIGNVHYQNQWAVNVIKLLHAQGFDGVFMDDSNPTIKYHYTPSQVAKYPNDAAYGAATTTMIDNVGEAIRAAGKLAVANIGAWADYDAVCNPWLPHLSGALDEQFVKWGTVAGTGYAYPGLVQRQIAHAQNCEKQGKLYLCCCHSAAGDAVAAQYGWAAALIGGSVHIRYDTVIDYTTEQWFPVYDKPIGDPTGGSITDSTGVYKRPFTGGVVFLNPTTTQHAASIPTTYKGPHLPVASVTLPANSGLILTP
jgi:hypothetical protein